RTKQQLNLVVPLDEGLARWLKNRWDITPKKSPIATRFVYEAGWTACAVTSRTKQQLNLVVPLDEGLARWLKNRWDITPKKSP
ncbi:hypothetical protein C2U36_26845, partial [Escherichia coli]